MSDRDIYDQERIETDNLMEPLYRYDNTSWKYFLDPLSFSKFVGIRQRSSAPADPVTGTFTERS